MSMIKTILRLYQEGRLPQAEAMELLNSARAQTDLATASPVFDQPIAVVGMACRLPQADHLETFWQNLRASRHAVTEVPASRWRTEDYHHPSHPGLGYARWGAFLDDVDGFDPTYFGLSITEAASLDPQQRLMLMVGRHVLDHAGYSVQDLAGADMGVFVGARTNDYGRDYFRSLRRLPQDAEPEVPISRASLLGRSQNLTAAWLSDRFDLRGPSMVVDSACSSSLLSLHLACQSLRLGECTMALAGGVDLLLDPMTYVMLSRTKALSPDGRCFVFDGRANGYVPGEGCGAVLLKRLIDAQRDGDQIHAVVRASAVNNDGKTIGITTPSLKAQTELLASVYHPNGIHPESMGYIEVHGTGTAIGDPIEIKALTEVFRRNTERSAFCGIGSLKTNIGHLHSAAGIAGFIKTVLCLEERALPASLNCANPNPRFSFVDSPFYPNLRLRSWSGNTIRRAGISGFGFGGTNCHMVLEEGKPHQIEAATRGSLPRTHFNLVPCVLPQPVPKEPAGISIAAPASPVPSAVLHPLVDSAHPGADVARFQKSFSMDDVFLRDHLVLGVPMVPGVTWLEFIRAGALACGLSPVTGYKDLTFMQPLCVGPGQKLVAQGTLEAEGHFEVVQVNEHGDTTQLVRGIALFDAPAVTPNRPPLEGLGDPLAGEAVFQLLRDLGYLHGAFFQNIGWMADAGPQATYAWLHRGERPEGWAERLPLDPGLLDSATIVAFGSQNKAAVRSGGSPFIPLFIGSVRIYDALPDQIYVYTRIHVWNAEMCRCTQMLCDVSGRVHVVFEDIVSKRVPMEGFVNADALDEALVAGLRGAAEQASEAYVARTAGARDQAFTNVCLSTSPQEVRDEIATTPLPQTMQVGSEGDRPDETTEVSLLDLLNRLMGIEIGSDQLETPFLSLGLDSAALVNMTAGIERHLGIQLYPTIFFEQPTPAEFLAYLEEEHGISTASTPVLSRTSDDAHEETPTTLEALRVPIGQEAPKRTHTEIQNQTRYCAPNETDAVFSPGASNPEVGGSTDLPEAPAFFPAQTRQTSYEPIAIIGMACRYPGSPNLEAFHRLLEEGRDVVGEIPADRWDWRLWYDPEPGKAGRSYSRWGGFIDDVALFDPLFFGIAPSDAAALDPQVRLFMEIAYATLEHAGYARRNKKGDNAGVFVGYSHDHYYEQRIRAGMDHFRGIGISTGAANQFSYFMNWQGPSIVTNSLCSSSLVAVHQAINALHLGECHMALAGGVHAALCPEYYVSMSHQRALSPSGRCRTFDAAADGYVPGEGVGAVLLKPLSRAQADGDKIHAVIRGSAVNHAGRAGRPTAPNPEAQTRVIQAALKCARLGGDDIAYVETHGTGTALGDPIEINALRKALDDGTLKAGGCSLGALKSQIGHLESAAGIAGLHKVVLALQHEQLPPTLHVANVNPALQLSDSPFRLCTSLQKWPADRPKRAGLSSFGMLGTNAHLIIEAAPAPAQTERRMDRTCHVLTLSARDHEGLRANAAILAKSDLQDAQLPDQCYSLNHGREHLRVRLALPVTEAEAAREHLHRFAQSGDGAGMILGETRGQPRLAWMFTGQGAQYRGMAEALYQKEPSFAEALERIAAHMSAHLDVPLVHLLFDAAYERTIHETRYSQPALFAVELALAHLWRTWNVTPAVVLGHSIGEYAAAVVAGVMDEQEAAQLVCTRGRLMQAQDPHAGGMTAVFAAPDTLRPYLARYNRLEFGAVNGPENLVLSGCKQQLAALGAELKQAGIKAVPLNVSHAFHSAFMDPAAAPFRQACSRVKMQTPKLPLIENINGTTRLAAPDADYWADHLRRPIHFADCLAELASHNIDLLLEIGPHGVLCSLADANPSHWQQALPSLQRGRDAHQVICQTAAALHVAGVPLDWRAFDGPFDRRRTDLPPFARRQQRFWLDAPGQSGPPNNAQTAQLGPAVHTTPKHPPHPTPTQTTKHIAHPLLGELVSQ